MAQDDDDGTYRIVTPSERAPKKTAGIDETLVEGMEPPPRSSQPGSEEQSAEDSEEQFEEQSAELSDEPSDATIRGSRHALTVTDIEQLIERGEYKKVCELLGPPDRARDLSPPLALLYIIARAELGQGPALADLPHLAMETSAKLLGLPARSRASRMVAKRLLGMSSADLRRRMPGAIVRITLIVAALIAGIVVGWLAGPGGVNLGELLESFSR